MRGNLIWSMRTLTAKFVEDENGKFEIVNGQVEPIVKVITKVKTETVYQDRPEHWASQDDLGEFGY